MVFAVAILALPAILLLAILIVLGSAVAALADPANAGAGSPLHRPA